MNLFFLINSLAGGGAENVLIRILPFLKPQKIFLIEKEIKYQVDEKLIESLSSHTQKTNPILKTLFIPIYSFKLSKKINKNSVVLSFLERANFANILAKSFSHHKAIISVHMNILEGNKGLRIFNRLLIKIFYPRADLIIAVSEGVKTSLKKIGIPEEKIKVIYNPFPIQEIKENSKESLEKYDKLFKFPIIINVGRLTKQKGQWHLIRILKELKKYFSTFKIVILGDGELKDYLINLSKSLGLKTFVWDKNNFSLDFDIYFLGFQKNPYKFIKKSKIFVLSSLWEGFSNVLIESLACETPIISTDCKSGPREILAPETDFNYQASKPEFGKYGILMPVFDNKFKNTSDPLDEKEKMWLEFLKDIFKKEEIFKKYSEISLERAKDFDTENIIKDWKKILKDFNIDLNNH